MAKNQKVIWGEGMFLTPQHFQHWDHYYEMLVTQRLRILSAFDWGVSELDIDRDGLANGRFALLGFQGVLADGLVIRVPDHDDPPQIRPLAELFPVSLEQLDVFLGIPVERLGAANCKLNDVTSVRPERYSAEYIQRPDANTGENVREILVARKNLKIFFSGEEQADTVALKIAELIRSPAGTIVLRDSYIPPCLHVSASGFLLRLARSLLELLSAKSNSFGGTERSALDAIGSDLGKFSLVHTLFAHLPLLTHVCHVQKVHPEALYLILARLAGELMVVSDPAESKELPLYQHEDLSRTFSELDRKIRSLVEGVTPTRYFPIPLEPGGENVWVGRVSDSRLFAGCQFFLTVSGDLPEDQIRNMVPHHIRIGSVAKLKEIVAAAMPGVRIYHTPRPPSSLPPKARTQYFRLDTHGVFWDEIRQSQVIALHVPETLKGLHIELLAVKE